MSLQDVPEIPGVDPAAVKALTRLCAGEEGKYLMTQAPRLVDIGDDIYVIFTDGMTAIMLQVEGDELPDLDSSEEIQNQFGRMIRFFGSDYSLYYEDIDIRSILDWCGEGAEKCPKCGGSKVCMFPRHQTAASKRENPDVLDAHTGRLGDVHIDRRRLQIPLQFLGVDEGGVDVVVVDDPGGNLTPEGETTEKFSGVALIGENWRIYTAGLTVEEDRADFYEKVPRFPL